MQLSIPDGALGAPGGTTFIPIVATPAAGIGLDLKVTWDPAVLQGIAVHPTPITQAYTLNYSLAVPGQVVISLFGNAPLTGSGPIVEMEFQVLGAGGSSSPLLLIQGDIDEGNVSTCLDSGSIAVCTSTSPESCNGLDDDCDGSIDEGLGQITCGTGACTVTVDACAGGVPQTCTPGTPVAETCNGLDDDCDGSTDEAWVRPPAAPGPARPRCNNCVGGVPQTCTPGTPVAETCNGLDDDCDGSTDDGLGQTTCGTGACQVTVDNCMGGVPQTCTPGNSTPRDLQRGGRRLQRHDRRRPRPDDCGQGPVRAR